MLAGLDMTSTTFTYQENGMSIVIEVCEPGSYGSVDYFQIGIYEAGQASSCVAPTFTPPPLAALLSPRSPRSRRQQRRPPLPKLQRHNLLSNLRYKQLLKNSTPKPTLVPTPDPTPPLVEEIVSEKNDPECHSMVTDSLTHGC